MYYIQYWDVNIYDLTMSQKLPGNNFEWIKYNFHLNEKFVKNINRQSEEWNFFEVNVQYLEKLHELCNDLQVEKLIYMIKLNMLYTSRFKTGVKSWISF